MLALSSLLVFVLVVSTNAHMSIWLPSLWGLQPDNRDSDLMAQPLEDFDFNDWWWHGPKSLASPPPAGVVTSLPAGGTHDFEITGNKDVSSIGWRGLCSANDDGNPRDPPNPWDNGWNGHCTANVHAPKRTDVAGCALAISYKSKQSDVKPEDFVVFSVVHDCIARPLQVFDIPALPACPNGLCICSWFWIHNSIGGTDQMYMSPFQCNITNPSKRVIGTPVPPVRCDGQPSCYLYPNWGNKTTVCKKPLQPMYWANQGSQNMANPTNSQCAPIYASYYGYDDGAQNNIFVGLEEVKGSLGDTLLSNTLGNFVDSAAGTFVLSPHFATKLEVLDDGNVVFSEVDSKKIIWSSNTANVKGIAPYRLVMQNDGNLVLNDSKGTTFWTSGTAGVGCAPYKLKVRDVASLSVVDCNGNPIWIAK